MNHIAHIHHVDYTNYNSPRFGKTLCGQRVYGRKRGTEFYAADNDPVLDYYTWLNENDETCLACEMELGDYGLPSRRYTTA